MRETLIPLQLLLCTGERGQEAMASFIGLFMVDRSMSVGR